MTIIKSRTTTECVNKCVKSDCKNKEIYESLCKEHFMEEFEKKVFSTVKEYSLIENNEKITCAVSGGKDSLTALYLVKKYCDEESLNCEINAVAVDEGIPGYRDKTIEDVKKFCNQHGVNLKIVSFKEKFGKMLVEMERKRGSYCFTCGILRRNAMNEASSQSDKLVTGHNLDDEVQTVIMNIFFGKTDLMARMGPLTGTRKIKGFVQKIKPLYLCTEKEVTIYAIIKGFRNEFSECPNAKYSFRAAIRDELNSLENSKEIKTNIMKALLKLLPKLKEHYSTEKNHVNHCQTCSKPSAQEVCGTCTILEAQ